MSWWVTLEIDGNPVKVPPFEEGGTYVLGGSDEAELNITWNYSQFYDIVDAEKGLRWLDGKRAKDCIERMEDAVTKLGTTKDSNYWAKTSGNAGAALNILLGWARANPEAKFKVT